MELPWRLPLMQAPIGPAASPEFVATVSAAGALGTLAASWTPAAELREQVRWLRSHSSEPFCVNLVLAFDQRERLAVALGEHAPFVAFTWGIDAELISAARQAGAFVLVQVGSVDEAHQAAQARPHALIVQGVEAGGHSQSARPLLELLADVRRDLRLPIVAAGGIGDADRRDAAREAGADAVGCGTIFLAADEADIHPIYLDHLLKSTAPQTVRTLCFDNGWPNAPHRVIRNATITAWETAGTSEPSRPGEGEQIASRSGRPVHRYDYAQPTSNTHGDVAQMAMYAGTSVDAVQRREPASRIVERLAGPT